MLYNLKSGLQWRFECHETYEMFWGRKLGFQARAHVKRYKTSDDFLNLQTKENSSASEQVLKMDGHYNRLNQVGVNLPDKIVIDRVL